MKYKDTQEYIAFIDALEKYNFINPLMCYEGNFPLNDTVPETGPYYDKNKDILWLNAKQNVSGDNKYEIFCRDNFYAPVVSGMESINQRALLSFYPMINSDIDVDRKGRHLEFSYHYSLLNMVEGGAQIDPSIEDISIVAELVKDYLKAERNAIAAYIRGAATPEQLERVNKRFVGSGVEITESNLSGTKDLLTKFIGIVRNIKLTYEEKRTFRSEEFMNCFDIDTFYMIFAKCCIHASDICFEIEGKVHNAFIQVLQYVSMVNDSGMKDYNPVIRYFDTKTGRVERYSFRDLVRDVNRVRRLAPDFGTFTISVEQGNNLKVFRDADALEKLSRLYSDEDQKVLKANWEFIGKGEREVKTDEASVSAKTSYSYTGTKEKKVDFDELLYRRMVFERTNYLYSIVGVDKFAGYVGYIYENGLVIFEKFYDDDQKTKISQSNATYIMSYDNFLQFTKLSKPEIIAAIKSSTNSNLQRLYHSKTWEERLNRIINGLDYNPEVVMAIEAIIHKDVLSQDEKKLK